MSVIEVEHLIKRYAGKAVVDDISFTVEEGEILAILGPNGAGKTTTVECVAGLRRPDEGRITVLGLDPDRDGTAIKERLGIQLQASRFADKLTVAETLELFSAFYPDPAPWPDLLDELDLADKRDTRFAKLSGGQKQRVSIAVALVGNPRIAILDELTTGLDPQARRDTWGLVEGLRDRGVTIVLVTHFMEEAERLADRVALIDGGRLVALDTPAGLVSRVDQGQRIRFRPSAPVELAALGGLDGVTDVTRHDDGQIVLNGTAEALHALVVFLAREQIVAEQLRVDTTTLDDAFVALTARPASARAAITTEEV